MTTLLAHYFQLYSPSAALPPSAASSSPPSSSKVPPPASARWSALSRPVGSHRWARGVLCGDRCRLATHRLVGRLLACIGLGRPWRVRRWMPSRLLCGRCRRRASCCRRWFSLLRFWWVWSSYWWLVSTWRKQSYCHCGLWPFSGEVVCCRRLALGSCCCQMWASWNLSCWFVTLYVPGASNVSNVEIPLVAGLYD